jgi:hypothetical protein
VAKIEEFTRVLTDKSKSRDERAEALKFIVHFVGDIHQPLHTVKGFAGGNGIHVSFLNSSRCGRYKCNLHGVWDSELIEHSRLNREEYVQHEEAMITADQLGRLDDGAAEQWANESLKLAQAAWVQDGAELDERYYERQIRVVNRQMALAGVRLARLLNDTIGKMTPKDFQSSPQPSVSGQGALSSQGATQSFNVKSSAPQVWVNTKSGVYHCPDSRWYGNTKQGKYMNESEALKGGYRPAAGRACQSPE